ncbi:MAG: twin-arginine translocase TatA/TatE family subunit [Bacteroidota bacterium]
MFLPLLFEDIAFSEIVVIMLVVLLFFGAKSIPGIAKTLGKTLYEFRNAQAELQREIQKSGMDIKKDMNFNELIKDPAEEIRQPLDQVATEINNTVEYKNPTTSGNPVSEINSNTSETPLDQPQNNENKEL